MGCSFSKEKEAKLAELEPPKESSSSLAGVSGAPSKSQTLTSTSSSADTFRTSQEERNDGNDGEFTNVVDTLLTGIGLPQYVDAFKRSGYDDKSVLLDITEKDFVDIESFAGLTILPGHRKRIMLASKKRLWGGNGSENAGLSESLPFALGLHVNTPTDPSRSRSAQRFVDSPPPPSLPLLPIESHALNSTSVSASGKSEDNVLYLSFGTDKLEGKVHAEPPLHETLTSAKSLETEEEDRFDDIQLIGDGKRNEEEEDSESDAGTEGGDELGARTTWHDDSTSSAMRGVPTEAEVTTFSESEVAGGSETAKTTTTTTFRDTSDKKDILPVPLASEMPKVVLARKRKSRQDEEEDNDQSEEVAAVSGKENFLPAAAVPPPPLIPQGSRELRAQSSTSEATSSPDSFVSKFKEAFEESMKVKIAALSDTLNRQNAAKNAHTTRGAPRSRRGSGKKKLEHIEKSIKTTEFHVKKRIADIVDNYSYKS
jgi:hypothetical protein